MHRGWILCLLVALGACDARAEYTSHCKSALTSLARSPSTVDFVKLWVSPPEELQMDVWADFDAQNAFVATVRVSGRCRYRLGAEWLDRYLTEWSSVRLEITGEDLLAAGVPEGPALGRGLGEALRRKLDGEVSGRDAELRVALDAARR